MDVTLLVTKSDFCLPNLQDEFQCLAVPYHIEYIENNPELVITHNIRHSPNILVNGQLVFRYQPGLAELKEYFAG